MIFKRIMNAKNIIKLCSFPNSVIICNHQLMFFHLQKFKLTNYCNGVPSFWIIRDMVSSEFGIQIKSDGHVTDNGEFLICWWMDLIHQASDLSASWMCIGATCIHEGVMVDNGTVLGNGS